MSKSLRIQTGASAISERVSQKVSGLLVCRYVVFSLPQRGTRRPRRFLLTEGWMGWMGWDGMGWMVGPLFFFGPYLENYFIIFLNFYSSFKYMFLQLFLEYSRKKIGMFFFSKNFAKIGGWFFFRLFEHKFANFSKTTRYFFLIVFGPLRRLFKTSSAKK